MSEYQYYEFQAIDRPLTESEIRELRAYSTRARITATSFLNEYNWGDFKGNPDRWMEKYFDAFIYFANWGTHTLMLSLPSTLLDIQVAKQYCSDRGLSVREKNRRVILTFDSEDDDREFDEDEGNWGSLTQVRSELARGDLRALYLGWLLGVQNGELDEDGLEPPVPAGLGQLSAPLINLAEFLRLDPDLLSIAAQTGPPLQPIDLDPEKVRAWVTGLPVSEKDELITGLIVTQDKTSASGLLKRYLKEQAPSALGDSAARRTVGELLSASDEMSDERNRAEVEKASREKELRERTAAIARHKHLDELAGREPSLWTEVENLIATRQPKSYDLAVKIILDLRDLSLRSQGEDFASRLESLRKKHSAKPSLLQRLIEAGL